MATTPFSRRHGLRPIAVEIRVRNDAPSDLRAAVVAIAYETGMSPTQLREVTCDVLRKAPNENNWSDFPNVDVEVRGLLQDCTWYIVYDVIERLAKKLARGMTLAQGEHGDVQPAVYFTEEINSYFASNGIGWQLEDGLITTRGTESFEDAVHGAVHLLDASGGATASSELSEAIRDLSRRPEPDVTGAIQHAMAALECVARQVCGSPNATLGDILSRHPDLFPKPLGKSVGQAWGYSSNTGRHLKEGSPPSFEEAELIVGLSGTLCRYLARKLAT